MTDRAAWLHDLVDELAPGAAVHLVGHSFGGATAVAYAPQHPDRVATLMLLEPVLTLARPPLSISLWWALVLLPTPQSWRDEALRRTGGTDDDPGPASQALQDPLARMIDVGAREDAAMLPTPSVLDAEQLAALECPSTSVCAARTPWREARTQQARRTPACRTHDRRPDDLGPRDPYEPVAAITPTAAEHLLEVRGHPRPRVADDVHR